MEKRDYNVLWNNVLYIENWYWKKKKFYAIVCAVSIQICTRNIFNTKIIYFLRFWIKKVKYFLKIFFDFSLDFVYDIDQSGG